MKCIFLALSDPTQMEPVELAEPLDLSATVAAPPMAMPGAELLPDVEPSCWRSKNGSGVLTQERAVE